MPSVYENVDITTLMWKTISAYPNYEISEYGHIRRSINCKLKGIGWWQKKPGELLKTFQVESGYVGVKLCNGDPKKNRIRFIHTLIATAFHGPKSQPHLCALHKDDNKLNNHYSNIYWGTKKNNAIDRCLNGKCSRSKLMPWEIRYIRRMYKRGLLQREIAKIFGIKQNAVSRIVLRQCYFWVD